ncbi:FadR/GntR family transcriptional regulator [Streptomyces albipurpureus]|uniref:FCD domain-containing protein n=1 Tax=Streptomyces albipurpureus TaxID=2897419 RepID=A0ABT0V1M9_9ACTN|nr:FCD domain-containing protein [Streptomyces sp. CWNU-1]MCM2394104.1 FCD domain-containing protein [Streptomyces sp. CWNU-1]
MALPGKAPKADTLAHSIEDLIARRHLTPGDHIATKDELRRESGVARATVNEAVRLLQARGRVVLRPGPGGGLFVAPTDPVVRLGQTLLTVHSEPVSVIDAVSVRNALEPVIAEEAARFRGARDIADLRVLIDALSDVVGEPGRFLRVNWRLHERIARISRNHIARTMYLGLVEFIQDQAVDVVSDMSLKEHRQYKKHRLDIHIDLVQAIIAGDPGAAVDAAKRHALQPIGSPAKG